MAYNVAAWDSFFTAVTAAAGALLGLVLTAAIVRIALIEAHRDLTARAYVLLAVLYDVLAAAIFPLAPISRIIIGWLFVAFGGDALRNFLIYLFTPSRLMLSRQSNESSNFKLQAPPKPAVVWPFMLSPPVVIGLGPIPIIVGGVSLVVLGGGGLYWVAPGVVLTLGFALVFLWGILVERYRADERPPES